MESDISRVLLPEEEIRRGLRRIAERLTEEYRGRELTVVGILHGSCVFVSDLIRLLPLPLTLEFIGCSSYGTGTVSTGEPKLTFIPGCEDLAGRNVLLVDDILDTGRTLFRVREALRARRPADLKTCVFLDKPARRVAEIVPDFRCFEIEDVFVVGYGLDFAGRYRNLPYIGALKSEVYAAGAPGRPSSAAR